MPNTNGHGPKRVILYACVSTDEQARSGCENDNLSLWSDIAHLLTCSMNHLVYLRDRRDVANHYPEMAGASHHDEEVPQLVETEDSGHQIGTF